MLSAIAVPEIYLLPTDGNNIDYIVRGAVIGQYKELKDILINLTTPLFVTKIEGLDTMCSYNRIKDQSKSSERMRVPLSTGLSYGKYNMYPGVVPPDIHICILLNYQVQGA